MLQFPDGPGVQRVAQTKKKEFQTTDETLLGVQSIKNNTWGEEKKTLHIPKSITKYTFQWERTTSSPQRRLNLDTVSSTTVKPSVHPTFVGSYSKVVTVSSGRCGRSTGTWLRPASDRHFSRSHSGFLGSQSGLLHVLTVGARSG